MPKEPSPCPMNMPKEPSPLSHPVPLVPPLSQSPCHAVIVSAVIQPVSPYICAWLDGYYRTLPFDFFWFVYDHFLILLFHTKETGSSSNTTNKPMQIFYNCCLTSTTAILSDSTIKINKLSSRLNQFRR